MIDCDASRIRWRPLTSRPQPTEWQRIGNQIDAAMIFAGAGLRIRGWNARAVA